MLPLGVNVLMLWASAMEKGYSCPLWLTYKQAAELNGQVRKGEKGSLVVYANTFTRTGTDGEQDSHFKSPLGSSMKLRFFKAVAASHSSISRLHSLVSLPRQTSRMATGG
jgi:antirestriction protein ArdC